MTLKAVIKVSNLMLIRKGIAKVEQKVNVYMNTATVPNFKLCDLFFLMPLSTLRMLKITANKILIALGYSHKSISVL